MKQSGTDPFDRPPGLAAVLASLDLTVESELLRYRRDRLTNEINALGPAPEEPDEPLAFPAASTPSPLQPEVSTPASASGLTDEGALSEALSSSSNAEDRSSVDPPQQGIDPLLPLSPTTQEYPLPMESHSAAFWEQREVPAQSSGPQPPSPGADLDPAIEDYLESSEALVKHLEAATAAPMPDPRPMPPANGSGGLVVLFWAGLGVIAGLIFAGIYLNPWRSPQPSPQPTNSPPAVEPSSGE
jgi:hypothetical protein